MRGNHFHGTRPAEKTDVVANLQRVRTSLERGVLKSAIKQAGGLHATRKLGRLKTISMRALLIVDNRIQSNYTKQHAAAAPNYWSNDNTIKTRVAIERSVCICASWR